MKTVILPTDFSKNSIHAINWALDFYKYEKANFVVLNTYKTPRTSSSSLVSLTELMHKQSLEDLAKLKKEILESHPEFEDRLETLAVFGDILTAVEFAIENVENEIRVVVGAKGTNAVKDILIGSNTTQLILNLKVPLYVIPENFNHKGFKRMALGVDYKNNINKEVLTPLRAIIEQTSTELYPFNIEKNDVEDNIKNKVKNELKNYFNLPTLQIASITDEDTIEGVRNFIVKNNIDCLVSVNRQKSFFERIFHKSFSKELASNTDIAMLILHD